MFLFYFGFQSLFSRQSFFNDWGLVLFNSLFTGYVLIFYVIMEIDLRPRACENLRPETYLYHVGQRNSSFNRFSFLGTIFAAVLESLFVYLFVYFLDKTTNTFSHFHESSFELMSTLVYAVVILHLQMVVCMHTRSYNWVVMVGYLLCGVGLYICYAAVGHMIWGFSFYETGQIIWMNLSFYLALFFLCLALFLKAFFVVQLR